MFLPISCFAQSTGSWILSVSLAVDPGTAALITQLRPGPS